MEALEKPSQRNRLLAGVCVLLLVAVYVFQKANYLVLVLRVVNYSNPPSPVVVFVFNKTVRLILNDLLCLGLIRGLFREVSYIRMAMLVFFFELLIVLPGYLTAKLYWEGSSELSSPLLSQIHRLIVNPMLMLILITGFYFQRHWLIRRI